jgi:hypothetical protein
MGYGLCGACCTPTNTFSGTVSNCQTGVATTVVLKNGSTTLWTGTSSSSGTFSGTAAWSGTITGTFLVTGTSSRWQSPSSVTKTLVAGAGNAVGNVGMRAASGFVCLSPCSEPVKNTLQLSFNAGSGLGGPYTMTLVNTAPAIPGTNFFVAVGGDTWTLTVAGGVFWHDSAFTFPLIAGPICTPPYSATFGSTAPTGVQATVQEV